MKKYNFYAGPAILPKEVIQLAAEAVIEYDDMGLSLIEISHRSPQFTAIMDESRALVKELLNADDSYQILFLTGGASSQFYMTALNLLNENETAAFVDTGTWSQKSLKEARHFGQIDVVASSKAEGYTYIPKDYSINASNKYLHLTSNNTIFGTQLHQWPKVDIPVVCDMSSDIFSRPIDINSFGLIYAGAQKNIGPAGVTLVIVKEELLGKVSRDIPTMLDYRTHIDKKSMFNTPPVFPIYTSMLTLRWIKNHGGLSVMDQRNQRKASLLYDEIDDNPMFAGVASEEDRSLMNVTFTLETPGLESEFLDMCLEAGCVGLKGHRSVGGFRASIYNAMEFEGVEVLTQVMKSFADTYG